MISVVMPTYNSEKYIRDGLESVLNQTYKDLDVIIIDDCSSDNTISIVHEYMQRDSRIRLFENSKNSGAGVSRNVGIDMALGEYIAFLDSDDIWDKNKLFLQCDYMKTENMSFCFTAYEIISEHGTVIRTVDLNNCDKVSYTDMLRKKATLGCSTVMLNKKRLGHIRMPDIRTGQDYVTWLNILKEVDYAFCLNKPLTQYRITPGSISRNKIKKAKRQWFIYRNIENLNLLQSINCFKYYAYRAIFRK